MFEYFMEKVSIDRIMFLKKHILLKVHLTNGRMIFKGRYDCGVMIGFLGNKKN